MYFECNGCIWHTSSHRTWKQSGLPASSLDDIVQSVQSKAFYSYKYMPGIYCQLLLLDHANKSYRVISISASLTTALRGLCGFQNASIVSGRIYEVFRASSVACRSFYISFNVKTLLQVVRCHSAFSSKKSPSTSFSKGYGKGCWRPTPLRTPQEMQESSRIL